MEWWQVIITVGSVLTATGVIMKFFVEWGKRIARQVVKHGIEEEMAKLTQTIIDLQETATRNTERLKAIQSELDANTVLTLKLELKTLFRYRPEEAKVIESTMTKYKSLGGDSYIDTLYEEWKEEYELPKFRKDLKKGGE